MSRGWLQHLPNKGYDPPLGCPTPTSENTPSRSTLAIWPRNTPHWLGLLQRPLRLFSGRCGRPTRKKSPCKRICSCWKVRAEIEGQRAYKPYCTWSVGAYTPITASLALG